MPQRLKFIWEDHDLNEELGVFSFSDRFKNLEKSIFCGKFSQPVSIGGAFFQIIHFTDLQFFSERLYFQMNVLGNKVEFPASNSETISLNIIEPGKTFD